MRQLTLIFSFLILYQLTFSQSDLLLPVWQGEELVFYQTDGNEKFRLKDYVFEKRFPTLDFDCFRDGLCLLKKGTHDEYETHYIDTSGKVIINLGENHGYPFSDGLANVFDKEKKKKGFINQTGEWVLEPKISTGNYFSNGYTMVQDAQEDSLGYMDKQGNILFKKSRKNAAFAPHNIGFSNGLALYKNGLFGTGYEYMNKKGEIVIQGNSKRAQKFSEGLAAIKIDYLNCGYIDTVGNLVISLKAKNCEPFSDSLAAVEDKGKWGFIDQKGEWVVPAIYKEVQPFKNKYTAVNKTNRWSLIDHKGQVIFEDSLANYLQYLGEEIVFVNYHGENNYAYYRLDSSLVVSPDPEYVQYTNQQHADLLPLESVESFSFHPFHNRFDEKVWGESLYSIGMDKRRWSRHSTGFPVEVLKYIHLKKLDLSYNRLREIPLEICGLEKLETLNLRDNWLKEFPKNLACLKHLKNLDLTSNDIATLPEEGLVFKNIKHLNLIANPIAKDSALLVQLKKYFPNATIITSRNKKTQVIESK